MPESRLSLKLPVILASVTPISDIDHPAAWLRLVVHEFWRNYFCGAEKSPPGRPGTSLVLAAPYLDSTS